MFNPRRSLVWMGVYLAVVVAVCAALLEPLRNAFMANWGFNSLILGVLVLGIVINLLHVLALEPEIEWIKLFRTGRTGISAATAPRLLGPLAGHLTGRVKDRFSLSALSLRTILDGIRERLDESREISRYMIGLLIFLGLLGTFWGLIQTINAVADVIAGLEVSARQVDVMFEQLKAGLAAPLSGMGTAFSSSLFGLGGSLVLGFLDILAGQAQNRFFNALEEWLSGVTQFIEDEAQREQPPVAGPAPAEMEALAEELRATRQLLGEALARRPTGD